MATFTKEERFFSSGVNDIYCQNTTRSLVEFRLMNTVKPILQRPDPLFSFLRMPAPNRGSSDIHPTQNVSKRPAIFFMKF